MTLVNKVLEIANSQMGVCENPPKSNSGKDVEKYLAAVGLGKGYPWCMAFVYWCVREAAMEVADGFIPLKKTGGVIAQWNSTDAKLKSHNPNVGDIFIMDYGKGLGHTGFVAEVDEENQTFTTIEGNSDSKGSRTGGSVCTNTRYIGLCKGFIKLK